jgi:hypothetical protein
MTQKILVQVLFVLSLLPLVIYPGILMAGIMGLAAERRGGASGSALVETVAIYSQILLAQKPSRRQKKEKNEDI